MASGDLPLEVEGGDIGGADEQACQERMHETFTPAWWSLQPLQLWTAQLQLSPYVQDAQFAKFRLPCNDQG